MSVSRSCVEVPCAHARVPHLQAAEAMPPRTARVRHTAGPCWSKKTPPNKQCLKKNNKNSQNKIKAHMGSHKHTHSRGKSLESAHTSAYFKSQVLFFLFQLGAGGCPKKEKEKKSQSTDSSVFSPPGCELLQTTRRIHTWEIHGHTGNPAQLKKRQHTNMEINKKRS